MPETGDISVLIPLYRGRTTIKACLESLVAQTGVRLEIFLLDNGCPEDTGEWAGYFLAQRTEIQWKLFEKPKNIGFAQGMNFIYAKPTSPWILFLNQDVTLAPDHLSNLLASLKRHPDWGGVCGTLFRSRPDAQRAIDTTGHIIFRDRIVRNRGTGKTLEPGALVPWPEAEVFGLSAACALYRREAIEASREIEGPFDPDFFSYFEDIDLDYRMHRSGWKLGFTPEAVGWHVLAGSGARRELSVRLRAYGNRRRILWKHESLSSLLPDALPIIIQDTYSFFRAIFSDPLAWLLGPWVCIWSLPRILARRRRMDALWGTDRKWIRSWLRPEHERWSER